jgi:hypothetical protein
MPIESKIVVAPLDEPRRGPGGHWYKYRATSPEVEGVNGYGQTEFEARQTLKTLVLKIGEK